MQVHRAYWDVPKAARYGVVAIGNFDGVHRGHRALLAAAGERAKSLGVPLGVITFEPHPREVLIPDQAPARLTPFRVKAKLLAEIGVEHLFALRFTELLRQKTPDAFVHDVLAGGLGSRHVVVGFDFRFGYRAKGDFDTLRRLGEEYGFGVTKIEQVTWRGGICSSSRIRDAIAAGEIAAARDLLGHPFMVEGRVVPGDRRGRELGCPTANLRPPDHRPGQRGRVLWPAAGIYAVRVAWEHASPPIWRDAVASLGCRPTFGGGDLSLEVHVFDQEVDLYGQRLCCRFFERLRGEEAFDGAEQLQQQMERDCAQARALLASKAP